MSSPFTGSGKKTFSAIILSLIALVLLLKFGNFSAIQGQSRNKDVAQKVRTRLLDEQTEFLSSGKLRSESPFHPMEGSNPPRVERLRNFDLPKTKYQHIQAREQYFLDQNQNPGELAARTLVVADHVIVRAAPNVSETEMKSAVSKAGGHILSVLSENRYLAGFEPKSPEDLDAFISKLRAEKNTIAGASVDIVSQRE